ASSAAARGGSGTKLSASPLATTSKPRSGTGNDRASPGRKAARGSTTRARAAARKPSEVSTPTTRAGSASASTAAVSAPVPQPTPAPPRPPPPPSHRPKSSAPRRLHRPTYASYASPTAHASAATSRPYGHAAGPRGPDLAARSHAGHHPRPDLADDR